MKIDYTLYGLTKEQADVVEALTPEQLEYAYRLKKRDYNMQDAEAHANILLEDDPETLDALDDSDFDEMAQRFEDRHDCNVPDNVQMDDIVQGYIDEGR